MITVWQKAPRPAGLLYRELCRQEAAWNNRVSQEIQEINPFDFLEYAIVLADQDPAELGLLPDELAPPTNRLMSTFNGVYRFLGAVGDPAPELVLFNLFTVEGPPGALRGFITNWPVRASYQSKQNGCVSAVLHQHRGVEEAGARAPVSAFNRAEWRDVDA